MSDRENALDFFQNYLPGELVKDLDLQTLKLQKDTFVDDTLNEGFSDTLYRVNFKTGGNAFLYVLFDHKSRPDRFTALQLLSYMVKIWQSHRNVSGKKKRKEKLPLILPIVVYHGQKTWNHGNSLESLFEFPEHYRKFVPNFEFLFYDLPKVEDEHFTGNEVLQASFTLFKYTFHPDLGEKLGAILQKLENIKPY